MQLKRKMTRVRFVGWMIHRRPVHRFTMWSLRLHLELLLRLLALAGETDYASRSVDEATDEETLRGRLARGILTDLAVELIRPNHVTAVSVDALLDAAVGVQLLHCDSSDHVLGEVVGVNVVLGGDPTDIDQVGVLAREDPDTVEELVHQVQGLLVQLDRFFRVLGWAFISKGLPPCSLWHIGTVHGSPDRRGRWLVNM